jgi:hypothetical protein
MNREYIYTSIREAKAEIKRRQSDLVLKKKLDDFWGKHKPDFHKENQPRLVLSKSLVTPNREFEYFLDISHDMGLEACLWEYQHGKFVGKNQEKRHLGKLFFHHGLGKHHGHIITHKNIIDFNTEEGKLIKEVNTINNMKLPDFHHEILSKRFPDAKFELRDISDWFNKTRNLDEYYVYYLSLFIRDHILFENFIYNEVEESKFTFDKFIPSFEKVTKMFGVKPLIVPLLPHEHEKSDMWFMYDDKTKKIVEDVV